MHADAGRLLEPLARLLVEVAEIVEGAPREEVAFDVAEGILDLALALLVRLLYPRRDRRGP
jgi:hypothetical protein